MKLLLSAYNAWHQEIHSPVEKNGYLLLPIGTKSILILLSTLGSLLLTTSLNLKQFIIEGDLQAIIFALQHLSIPQGFHHL